LIDPPVSWKAARTEILACAVRQAAELALLAEGVEDLFSAYQHVTSRTALLKEELRCGSFTGVGGSRSSGFILV